MFFGLKFSELNLALRHKQKIFYVGCYATHAVKLNWTSKNLKNSKNWNFELLGVYQVFWCLVQPEMKKITLAKSRWNLQVTRVILHSLIFHFLLLTTHLVFSQLVFIGSVWFWFDVWRWQEQKQTQNVFGNAVKFCSNKPMISVTDRLLDRLAKIFQ